MPLRLSALLALVFLSAPAAAQNEWKWGAIAYGTQDGVAGWAVDYPNAEEAREAALERCGGRCTRTITFRHSCAAVARTPAGHWDSADNPWQGRAVIHALARCERSGPGCILVVWACTRR